MERRTFVRLAGIASIATTAGLAGCQGDGDDGSDGDETTAGDGTPGETTDGTPDGEETPDDEDGPDGSDEVTPGERAPYDSWVIPESVDANNQLVAVSLDVATLSQAQNIEGSDDEALNADPVATTATGFLFIGLFSTAALRGTGLTSLSEADSPTEQFHLVGSALVLEGAYDAASLGSDAASAGLTEAGTYNGYTLYEGDTKSVGISDSAVILADESSEDVSDATARVQAHVDAANGDKALYSDQEDPFDDLVGALPARAITGVAYTPDASPLDESNSDSGSDSNNFANTGLDGNAHGLANSADISPDSLTSSLAIRYESASEVNDRATIESALGTAADSRVVNIDDTLVVVEGEYSAVPSLQ